MEMTAIIIIVGAIVWIPSLLLVGPSGGSWFNGTEIFGALGPVLALAVPGFIRAERGLYTAMYAIAIAPILMLIGSLCAFLLQRAIFGSVSTKIADTASPLLALMLWSVLGLILYRLFASPSKNE